MTVYNYTFVRDLESLGSFSKSIRSIFLLCNVCSISVAQATERLCLTTNWANASRKSPLTCHCAASSETS